MKQYELDLDELRASVTVHKQQTFAQQLYLKRDILKEKGYEVFHAKDNGNLLVVRDGYLLFDGNRFVLSKWNKKNRLW